MCEPVACTPAAGWEKGQVENQVGNVREWLFTPRVKVADFNTLNVWLVTRCEELAGRQHPVEKTRTIAECFSDEQPLLRPITADKMAMSNICYEFPVPVYCELIEIITVPPLFG